MSKNLIIDKKRNIIYDIDTKMAEVFESFSIQGKDSRMLKEAAVEYDVSEIDGEEQLHIVPEIVCMIEGPSHNGRYYPSESMKSRKKNAQGTPGGAASFTIPVERPMLINHNSEWVTEPFEGIAVGYIESAKYTPAKNGEKAQIRIWPRIVDPMAVQMIRDGRLKSVSIRAKTDKMICSICGVDVLAQYRDIQTKGADEKDKEPCVHWPSNKYDGKECYYSIGTLWFQETSFVTIPGVDGAKILISDVNENDKSGTKIAKEYEIERWLPNIVIVDEEELNALSHSVLYESHPDIKKEDKEETKEETKEVEEKTKEIVKEEEEEEEIISLTLVMQEILDNHKSIHEEYKALKDSGKMTKAKRQALVGRHLQVSESLYVLTKEPHSAEDELDSATWSFLK